MSIPGKPAPAALLFAVLYTPDAPLDALRHRVEMEFSPLSHQMHPYKDAHAAFYEREMGEGLLKTIWVCRQLINPRSLVSIKLHTNRLETHYSTRQGRTLNIDPGYMDLARVVLATGKDRANRVYMDRGIYEEITLLYATGQGYQPLPWTYPDYRREDVLQFLEEARRSIHQQQSVKV